MSKFVSQTLSSDDFEGMIENRKVKKKLSKILNFHLVDVIDSLRCVFVSNVILRSSNDSLMFKLHVSCIIPKNADFLPLPNESSIWGNTRSHRRRLLSRYLFRFDSTLFKWKYLRTKGEIRVRERKRKSQPKKHSNEFSSSKFTQNRKFLFYLWSLCFVGIFFPPPDSITLIVVLAWVDP